MHEPLRRLVLVVRFGVLGQPFDEQNGERFVQLQETLHLVEEKLKNDPPSIDSGVGHPNRLVVVSKQVVAPDCFRAARRNKVAEGDGTDQVIDRRPRATTAANCLNWRSFRNKPTRATTNALPSRSYSVPRWCMAWLHLGHRYPPSGSIANSGGMPT